MCLILRTWECVLCSIQGYTFCKLSYVFLRGFYKINIIPVCYSWGNKQAEKWNNPPQTINGRYTASIWSSHSNPLTHFCSLLSAFPGRFVLNLQKNLVIDDFVSFPCLVKISTGHFNCNTNLAKILREK